MIDGVGKFMDHIVPFQVDMLSGEVKVATSKIVKLSSYVPQPGEFSPGADMKPLDGHVGLSGGVMAGNRMAFTQPAYPEGAKQRHESGTVILHAVIGRDGLIRRLRPANAADPEFVVAAIAAVRHWAYKPYLLNGEPTEVDTTITVNFAVTRN